MLTVAKCCIVTSLLLLQWVKHCLLPLTSQVFLHSTTTTTHLSPNCRIAPASQFSDSVWFFGFFWSNVICKVYSHHTASILCWHCQRFYNKMYNLLTAITNTCDWQPSNLLFNNALAKNYYHTHDHTLNRIKMPWNSDWYLQSNVVKRSALGKATKCLLNRRTIFCIAHFVNKISQTVVHTAFSEDTVRCKVANQIHFKLQHLQHYQLHLQQPTSITYPSHVTIRTKILNYSSWSIHHITTKLNT